MGRCVVAGAQAVMEARLPCSHNIKLSPRALDARRSSIHLSLLRLLVSCLPNWVSPSGAAAAVVPLLAPGRDTRGDLSCGVVSAEASELLHGEPVAGRGRGGGENWHRAQGQGRPAPLNRHTCRWRCQQPLTRIAARSQRTLQLDSAQEAWCAAAGPPPRGHSVPSSAHCLAHRAPGARAAASGPLHTH